MGWPSITIMETYLTPSNITFALGIAALAFSIWGKIRDPQTDSEKRDALFAQQMKFTIESTELRFKEIQESFNALLLQSNNHIHTVDTKVENLNSTVISMGNEITRLATIIDERIPKSKP